MKLYTILDFEKFCDPRYEDLVKRGCKPLLLDHTVDHIRPLIYDKQDLVALRLSGYSIHEHSAREIVEFLIKYDKQNEDI